MIVTRHGRPCQVRLDAWLDLQYRDGRKSKWRSASFADQYQTIQAFIEAYGAHQALRGGLNTS